jgi:hypothetical protein
MPLIYALVGRGKTVLAEYTCAQGNFPTVTRILLAKIPGNDAKMSYVYDSHTFHYIVDNGIIFLCLSDGDMKRRLIFEFLEEIKCRWRAQFLETEQTAIAFAMNLSFLPVLKTQLVLYFLTLCSTLIADLRIVTTTTLPWTTSPESRDRSTM